MKLISKSLIGRAALFSLLIAIVAVSMLTGAPVQPSQAASSYPFPGRAEDLKTNEYWHFAAPHVGTPGNKALDLTGIRFSTNTGQWTPYKEDGISAADDYNSDFVIYDKPVHAIASGEVIACWRNAPNNIRPGDDDAGGTPHPGRLSSPRTIATSGNFLVVKSASENRTVLYAHLRPGSIPPGLCSNNYIYMNNADNKYDPVAGENIEYPIESVLPVGNRPQITEGQQIGNVGNAGASSGPHLHIDMSDIIGPNDEGPSLPIPFDDAWTQHRTPGVNVDNGDWQLMTGQELTDSPRVILPDYSGGKPELAKHGVSASNFQFVFSHIKYSGYRPVWIDGYEVNGNNYFNAIFRPADGTNWVAKSGLTGAQYQDEFDLRTSQGYRPLQVESYPDGNTIRYAVIFVQQSGQPWTAYHGLTTAQHQAAFNNLFNQGYIPRNISVVSFGGERYHTAFYEQVSFGSLIAHSFLTPSEYQTMLDANAAVGRDLVYVNAYNYGNSVRFSAIWQAPIPRVSVARYGESSAGYQDEWEHWTGLGYLTRCVTGYEENNLSRFAGLWR